MILLLETVHPDAVEVLSSAGEVVLATDSDELRPERIRAVVTRGQGRVTAHTYAQMPNLEVVARCGAGLDNIDTAGAAAAGITVVHAPGVTTHAVAEHAVLLMLALARRLPDLSDATKSGEWNRREGYEGMELRGRRMGVIGLGAIGSRVAQLGAALEMDVVCATRRSQGHGPPRLGLDELLSTADVVQVCVASTPETNGLIGDEQLARMQPHALLVNTARGAIVDHDALGRALAAGAIGGYAADVWATEPPSAVDPVLAHPRVLVTPHVAGLTDLSYREICTRTATAVVAVLDGKEPDPRCVMSPS